MWLPDFIYKRVPVIYAGSGAIVLTVGMHSFVAWASAALLLSSAIGISYLRAIQPRRLRERAAVVVLDQPARPRAAAKKSELERMDVDLEISRWAETGFANVVLERPAAGD